MLKNSLFFSLILCLSVSFLSSVNCMQGSTQADFLTTLPDDLKSEIILRLADDEKAATVSKAAPEDRVKVLNRMKGLATTCKAMRGCFMENVAFNKRLSTLLGQYPSKSGSDFVKKTAQALKNCFIDRLSVRLRRKSHYMTKLADEEYQFRSKLI